jgi:hypothetical protein
MNETERNIIWGSIPPSIHSTLGNITLSTKSIGDINLTSFNPIDQRVEELEKKLDKIIEFINKFFDTEIKT